MAYGREAEPTPLSMYDRLPLGLCRQVFQAVRHRAHVLLRNEDIRQGSRLMEASLLSVMSLDSLNVGMHVGYRLYKQMPATARLFC